MGQKAKHTKTVTLVSKDDKGKISYSYQTLKNTKKDKIKVKKYNPRTKKHELFVETKSSK